MSSRTTDKGLAAQVRSAGSMTLPSHSYSPTVLCSNYISLGRDTGRCSVTGEVVDRYYCQNEASSCEHSGSL